MIDQLSCYRINDNGDSIIECCFPKYRGKKTIRNTDRTINGQGSHRIGGRDEASEGQRGAESHGRPKNAAEKIGWKKDDQRGDQGAHHREETDPNDVPPKVQLFHRKSAIEYDGRQKHQKECRRIQTISVSYTHLTLPTIA